MPEWTMSNCLEPRVGKAMGINLTVNGKDTAVELTGNCMAGVTSKSTRIWTWGKPLYVEIQPDPSNGFTADPIEVPFESLYVDGLKPSKAVASLIVEILGYAREDADLRAGAVRDLLALVKKERDKRLRHARDLKATRKDRLAEKASKAYRELLKSNQKRQGLRAV